jgi:hypothetical protein
VDWEIVLAYEPLWPFLIYEGLEGAAMVAKYRDVYLNHYVRHADGTSKIWQDWTGAAIKFPSHQFEHAFTQSQGYRQGLDHESFSLERAKRIMWIEQVLNASAGTINRYSSTRQSDRGRQLKRRTFFVNEENYLVVLNDPAKAGVPFQFVTAYAVMDLDYLRKLKQTSVLIETKKV